VGPVDSVDIPDGARVIDAGGGYVIPGLIDSFAALNHQAQANAYFAPESALRNSLYHNTIAPPCDSLQMLESKKIADGD
jgi:imidazolonepropionase-like amidohydrolase